MADKAEPYAESVGDYWKRRALDVEALADRLAEALQDRLDPDDRGDWAGEALLAWEEARRHSDGAADGR